MAGHPALIAIAGVVLLSGCSFIEEHRSVNVRMTWQCMATAEASRYGFRSGQSVRLWFVDNPRYYVDAYGSDLCEHLGALGQRQVAVGFETWGNPITGLRGYSLATLPTAAGNVRVYDGPTAGFVDTEAHHGDFSSVEDKKLHPEKYRFPLDTFR